MRQRHWIMAAAALALVPATLVAVAGSPSTAAAPSGFSATPLTPTSRATGAKSPTSRLAQTDPTLLNRSDPRRVPIMIKLSHDGLATYDGGVAGYEATSPAVTGRPLSGSAAERAYLKHLARLENAFIARLKRKVPDASISRRLRTVYGGLAATAPANRVADVLAIPGVVAVQADSLRQPLTDSSADFVGASSLYPGLGGAADAGKGVIFGVLDTGGWPEHSSYADHGALAAPPPRADGTLRTCDFGDNPLTPATDVFVCNNKLIGGAPFLTTYLSSPDRAAAEVYHTARDSNGHGTHTGTTAAGNVLPSASLQGVERGPIHGIAPGAWVSAYKVCGVEGCFSSDSAAAVEQAILDGVDVINFSISGGTDPFTDPVELAFLDAYAAGVFVAASAGNSGPGQGSVNHLSPWVTTVAASTQRRAFDSTLTLTDSGGDTLTLHGASITAGAGPLPVVLASAAPYQDNLCQAPAPAGAFVGKVVACQRGSNARVEKGFNVLHGGAAGMILYNPTLADVETDNHWLPTVHLADGSALLAFMAGHAGVTASFTSGQKVDGTGDVVAAFSSRGPGGLFIKPDVAAPGVQILAGHTPTPDTIAAGPAGQYFQAIAGTSMASPHVAGSAILLTQLHPDWTPGQIRSALMTTATTDLLKEDLTTPADPFDHGAGRVRPRMAAGPGLTFDETAANMALLGADPVHAVDLNVPSVNAPVMPGTVTTTRVATNVTGRIQTYHVKTSAPARGSISVRPSTFSLRPGASERLKITIRSSAPAAQHFGEISLDPVRPRLPTLHLPVAFVPQQGAVKLTSTCAPASIRWFEMSSCTMTATNSSPVDAEVDLRTNTTLPLPIVGASGATAVSLFSARKDDVTLAGARLATPFVDPGQTPAGPGYLPMSSFADPLPIGDEEIINFDVPEFVYAGHTFDAIGVDANGYVVVGGGSSEDNQCCLIPGIPDPSPPNNILAPFWTDLDGTGAAGIYALALTDGEKVWVVFEWDLNLWGTTSNRHFQVWIGVNGAEDISFDYDSAALPADPGRPFQVGAENVDGSGGDSLGGLPTEDLVVSSTPPTPGESVSYRLTVLGLLPVRGTATTSMTTPVVPGTTVVKSRVTITR